MCEENETDYFRVGTYSLSQTELKDILFDVYPNPSSGVLNVYLELPLKENITITLFDVNGRVLREIKKVNFLSELIFFDEMPSGIYTIILDTKNHRLKKNIVISK